MLVRETFSMNLHGRALRRMQKLHCCNIQTKINEILYCSRNYFILLENQRRNVKSYITMPFFTTVLLILDAPVRIHGDVLDRFEIVIKQGDQKFYRLETGGNKERNRGECSFIGVVILLSQ